METFFISLATVLVLNAVNNYYINRTFALRKDLMILDSRVSELTAARCSSKKLDSTKTEKKKVTKNKYRKKKL